jgi:hypothetical protein
MCGYFLFTDIRAFFGNVGWENQRLVDRYKVLAFFEALLKVTLDCIILIDECLGRREAEFIDAFKFKKTKHFN